MNGNLWVTHAWNTLGKVQLSTTREDSEETISKDHIEWLNGRKPKKGDLVYVPSQQGVFEVIYADRMNVRVK